MAWCLGAGILVTFQSPLFYSLSFVVLPLYLIWWLAGAGLVLFAAIRGVLRRNHASLASSGLVVACFLVLWSCSGWLAHLGDRSVARARFMVLHAAYERVVRHNALHGDRVFSWLDYEIDPGPPLRLAFPYSGGLLDNWQATVYDPTDAVASAQGWRLESGSREFTAPPGIRALFGGDLLWCYRLEDHYFRCGFT